MFSFQLELDITKKFKPKYCVTDNSFAYSTNVLSLTNNLIPQHNVFPFNTAICVVSKCGTKFEADFWFGRFSFYHMEHSDIGRKKSTNKPDSP